MTRRAPMCSATVTMDGTDVRCRLYADHPGPHRGWTANDPDSDHTWYERRSDPVTNVTHARDTRHIDTEAPMCLNGDMTTQPAPIPGPAPAPIPGVAWFLSLDEDATPAITLDQAREVCQALGSVLVPTEHHGDGVWLCDTDPILFETLTLCGWAQIEAGPFAAEADWPKS